MMRKTHNISHGGLPAVASTQEYLPVISHKCLGLNFSGLCGINVAPHLTAHFAIQRDRCVACSSCCPSSNRKDAQRRIAQGAANCALYGAPFYLLRSQGSVSWTEESGANQFRSQKSFVRKVGHEFWTPNLLISGFSPDSFSQSKQRLRLAISPAVHAAPSTHGSRESISRQLTCWRSSSANS